MHLVSLLETFICVFWCCGALLMIIYHTFKLSVNLLHMSINIDRILCKIQFAFVIKHILNFFIVVYFPALVHINHACKILYGHHRSLIITITTKKILCFFLLPLIALKMDASGAIVAQARKF